MRPPASASDSIRGLVALALVLLLTACGKDAGTPVGPDQPDPPAPTTIVVTPAALSLQPGDTARVSAQVKDQHGAVMTGVTVSWTSSDPSVATVSASGLVTALGSGSTDVAASTGGVSGKGTVSVTPDAYQASTMASGAWHTCALDASGEAYCWGSSRGLGDGTALPRETPVKVVGGHRFSQITASGSHTCGLATDGRVLCWGYNLHGEVDGTRPGTEVLEPVAVPLPGTVIQVAAGGEFTCALLDTGEAHCWGRNNESQLGRGTTSTATQTVGPVKTDERFVRLGLGRAHGCGLTGAGRAYCWGRNHNGQVGDGTTSQATIPVAVSGSSLFRDLAGGNESTCAADRAGAVHCWGAGFESAQASSPVKVADFADAAQVDVGNHHACGIDQAGAARCWGRNQVNRFGGALGTGDEDLVGSSVPLPVSGGLAFREIATMYGGGCGREASGQIWCWGYNENASLGSGDAPMELVPVQVGGGMAWSRVEAGGAFSCGLSEAGALYCWGSAYGTDGTPVALGGDVRFKDVAVGANHACGLDQAGLAYCWGNNSYKQLGDGTGTARQEPTRVATDTAFVRISAGVEHTCAITASGSALCWGNMNHYRLGNQASMGYSEVPTPGALGATLAAISVADTHGCGLDADGVAYCWGWGAVGSSDSAPVPRALTGPQRFLDVGAGDHHTCAVDVSGAAWCWGWGYNGRLGNGSTGIHDTPVAVAGGLAWMDVDAGKRNSCGVTTSGDVYCWGHGEWGELGNGTQDIETTPTRASLDVPAVSVSSARLTFFDESGIWCALTQDHRAFCWGWNDRGQVGQRVAMTSPVPRRVAAFP